MMEFRKEFFANERDDNLNEIGKPTRRQDILGHVTGRKRSTCGSDLENCFRTCRQ